MKQQNCRVCQTRHALSEPHAGTTKRERTLIEKPVTIEGTATVEMTYEEALACDRRIGQAFQTAGQAMAVAYDDLRAMLNRKGYKQLINAQTNQSFATWTEYLGLRWTLSIQRWEQIAGHVQFVRALSEAANNTAVSLTERATRPLRPQRESILAEVRERVASGQEPETAVNDTIREHQQLPTPGLAREIARETGVTVAASDGYYHDGRTAEEEERASADAGIIYGVLRAIKVLATVEVNPAEYLAMLVEADMVDLKRDLPAAVRWAKELEGRL